MRSKAHQLGNRKMLGQAWRKVTGTWGSRMCELGHIRPGTANKNDLSFGPFRVGGMTKGKLLSLEVRKDSHKLKRSCAS